MEAVTAEVADRPEITFFVGRADSLGGIFDDQQPMPPRDIHDHVHIAADAGVMNRNDHPGPGSDRLLDQTLVDIHGIRPDIDENRHAAPQDEGIRRGDKCVGRNDELIPGLNIAQNGRHLQSRRAGVRQQNFLRVEMLFQPAAAASGERSVSGQMPVLHRLSHVIQLLAGNERLVKRNFH